MAEAPRGGEDPARDRWSDSARTTRLLEHGLFTLASSHAFTGRPNGAVAYHIDMTLRRSAWVLTGIGGLPGLFVGAIALYALVLVPIVFGCGLAVGRSRKGIIVALGLFCLPATAFAADLAYGFGGHGWWFTLAYAASSLLALLATFKLGTEARVRLFEVH